MTTEYEVTFKIKILCKVSKNRENTKKESSTSTKKEKISETRSNSTDFKYDMQFPINQIQTTNKFTEMQQKTFNQTFNISFKRESLINWNKNGILILKLIEIQNIDDKESTIDHDIINIDMSIFLNGCQSYTTSFKHNDVKYIIYRVKYNM